MGKIVHQALTIVLLLISLPFGQCSTWGSQKSNDLIEGTCGKTRYHDVCVSALRSDPRSSVADVRGLARIILEISLVKAKNTVPYIHKLQDETKDIILKRWYDSCIQQYGEILGSDCPTAIGFLDNKSYREAVTWTAYLEGDAEDCETEFPKSNKSPIYDQNKALQDLAYVAIDIINLLI